MNNIPDMNITVHIPTHLNCEAVLMQASCHKEWKRASKEHRESIVVANIRHLCRVSIFDWAMMPYDDLVRLLPPHCEEYYLIKRAINKAIIKRIKNND